MLNLNTQTHSPQTPLPASNLFLTIAIDMIFHFWFLPATHRF
jgi:hypothetical protein